ncbi:MAG: LysM peptidoglycan-binding domain-containing protein [Candidatus Caldatribacteriota bacterium]|nr:LysM peptidoglycan-binding domain-containing protein [Candidatus Caldatribacteriota bacterium]
MSKNLIVLFIIILLIVGGFGIYTYDQSNQAKKEVEEKNLKLESNDAIISELKENIQEKEKQIEELKAGLAKGGEDLEKEYADKLTELTEEKAKLEVLLTEKEETIKTIEEQKEESEQIVISKDAIISELKENIQEKEKQIEELKVSLVKREKDLEKEYADKLSELTEEKAKLEVLLTEKEETIKTIEEQKEESEQIVISKDAIISELKENIQEKEKQIDELKAGLAKGGEDLEKEFVAKISELMKEKGQLEALLIEQEGNLQTKDREKEELVSKLEDCNNQITELKDKLVQQEIEKGKDYVAKLSALTEEKSKLEDQLKIYQDLLSEKEDTIALIKQQNKESEKNIVDKDKTIAELLENIKGYENLVKEIQEKMAQEGKEKEAEYADKLALLKEGKSIIEAKLAEAIKKSIPDYYEVKKGDSLWKIAERFYNAGEKWIRIFEANTNKIKNPSMIYPYQRFTIPKE